MDVGMKSASSSDPFRVAAIPELRLPGPICRTYELHEQRLAKHHLRRAGRTLSEIGTQRAVGRFSLGLTPLEVVGVERSCAGTRIPSALLYVWT
jgi:hypothetical protein